MTTRAAPRPDTRKILDPYHAREAISMAIAAQKAGKEHKTMWRICKKHGLGRKLPDSQWAVSIVALNIYLEGNLQALSAYHQGIRGGPLVARYFKACGLADLIDRGPLGN
jgi:hypothetical protein